MNTLFFAISEFIKSLFHTRVLLYWIKDDYLGILNCLLMQKEILGQRTTACNGVNLSDLSIIATEWNPALKWLGFRAFEDDTQHLGGSVNDDMVLNEEDDDEDEIEDW